MRRTHSAARLLVLVAISFAASSNGFAGTPDAQNKKISAEGMVDRVISSGPEPVFRAVGYSFRVGPSAEVKFGKSLTALKDVQTNTWVSFEGRRDASGMIDATKAYFTFVKMPKRKPNPMDVQVTNFPEGSKIDADKGFTFGKATFPKEDHGGWCGWYELPQDIALQTRIRELGFRIVPQYQRDLPADDPAKIPFRFYAVDGTQTRKAIFCNRGLIMVPMVVIDRLQSDNLLAAVLAEGVAGALQQQASDARGFRLPSTAELITAGSAAGVAAAMGAGAPFAGEIGGLITGREAARKLEYERARMSLALMADAGFDPHSAPDAWRLLKPGRRPKNMDKLKDTGISRSLDETLELQYKVSAQSTADHPAR